MKRRDATVKFNSGAVEHFSRLEQQSRVLNSQTENAKNLSIS